MFLIVKNNSYVNLLEINGLYENKNFLLTKKIVLRENSLLRHVKVIYVKQKVEEVNLEVDIYKNSEYELNYLIIANSQKISLNINVNLLGFFSKVILRGFAFLNNSTRVINNIKINHCVYRTSSLDYFNVISKCQSFILNKSLINLRGGSFDSSSLQIYKYLILSSKSIINVSPVLFINNKNISSKHGIIVGKIDREGLFYLRSRGLSDFLARKVLLNNFVVEVFNNKLIFKNYPIFYQFLRDCFRYVK